MAGGVGVPVSVLGGGSAAGGDFSLQPMAPSISKTASRAARAARSVCFMAISFQLFKKGDAFILSQNGGTVKGTALRKYAYRLPFWGKMMLDIRSV